MRGRQRFRVGFGICIGNKITIDGGAGNLVLLQPLHGKGKRPSLRIRFPAKCRRGGKQKQKHPPTPQGLRI